MENKEERREGKMKGKKQDGELEKEAGQDGSTD